jgi:peptidoglycan/LPS O-acetylase OafA/YrhL
VTAATTPRERWQLGYRPALDGLRGIAVLLVVGQHAGIPLFARAGSVGVTTFFVLSGFLITTLLLDEQERTGRIKFGAFYARRARRLLPALVAFLLVAVAVGVDWRAAVSAFFYAANWVDIAGVHMGSLRVTWSLSVEEQFYILWPIALVVIRPRSWMLWLGVGVGTAICLRSATWLLTGYYDAAFFATPNRADALFAGCMLAFVRGWQPHPWMTILAAIGLALPALVPSDTFLAIVGLPVATAASVIFVAWGSTSSARIMRWRPLVYIGFVSYSLYLWHTPVLTAVAEADLPIIVGILGAIGIAAVSRHAIEAPFLRRRH